MKEQNGSKEIYSAFYESVKKSYIAYLINGPRSTKKLKPLHGYMGNTIKEIISENYDVYYINGKEVKTEGGYYPKAVDVAIVKKNTKVIIKGRNYYIPKIDMAISIKFVTSNYRQNSNNYFENLLGECANLKSAGIKFAHFVVFRDRIPYFKSDKSLGHWEELENKDIKKYIRLHEDKESHLYAPDIIGLEIVKIHPIIEEIMNGQPPFTEDIEEYISNIKISNGLNNLRANPNLLKKVKENFNIITFLTQIKKILED